MQAWAQSELGMGERLGMRRPGLVRKMLWMLWTMERTAAESLLERGCANLVLDGFRNGFQTVQFYNTRRTDF